MIYISGKKGALYEKVQGFRNRAEQLPNQLDTAFAIASGTKLFTAVAICSLIDQGKLALESKVWEVLPYDLKNISKEVTIFHLLTHTSGIKDYLNEGPWDWENSYGIFDPYPAHQWTSTDFYLPLIKELASNFEPGAKQSYSNSGFILLGLVIEALSGKSYHDYIKDHVIKPLKMKHTGFYATNNLPMNTAIGYIYDEKQKEFIANYFHVPIIGSPDGGLFTTGADMALFWKGVFSLQFFSKNMLDQFVTIHSNGDYGDWSWDYGLGVEIKEINGKKSYCHSGSDAGVTFYSIYFPEIETAITFLLNRSLDIYSGDFINKLTKLLND